MVISRIGDVRRAEIVNIAHVWAESLSTKDELTERLK